LTGIAGDRAGTVLGAHTELETPGQYRVLGDQRALMEDLPMATLAHDLHGLADQATGHRVAIGVDAHQPAAARMPNSGRKSRRSNSSAAARSRCRARRCACGRRESRRYVEVREGAFVRGEQRTDALVRVALGKHRPRVAQSEHEDVDGHRLAGEPDPHLAPVDLALLAGRRFKATLRQRCRHRFGAHRPHGIPDRVVAAAVASRGAQFLKQDARRVTNLRSTLNEPSHVGREQRRPARHARIWPPLGLAQTTAHGLAIQTRLPRNQCQRPAFGMHAPKLLPSLLPANHFRPLVDDFPRGQRAQVRLNQFRHRNLRSPGVGRIRFPYRGLLGSR
jgi:hypothetical protein